MLTTTIDPTTAVDDVPEVRELRAKLDTAKAELQAAKEELDHLHRLLNPLPSSSEQAEPTVSKLDLLKAQLNIDAARDRFLLAQAEFLDAKQRYERVRTEATQQVNLLRSRARLPYLRRFADALEEAAAVGDALMQFDLETVALGGNSPGHPCMDICDSPPYRMGIASRVRALVTELERRS